MGEGTAGGRESEIMSLHFATKCYYVMPGDQQPVRISWKRAFLADGMWFDLNLPSEQNLYNSNKHYYDTRKS